MADSLLRDLAPQVKQNCLISDARYWGYYSMCGLLMRLRGLYRFEHGIKPWEKVDERRVLMWIGETEMRWEEASEASYIPISINGGEFDPFDTEGINEHLHDNGLLYGAGYGIHMKPVFFLSDLRSSEKIEGYDVYVAGKEYARDLSFHPAMLQRGTIIARAEITVSLIWDKFEDFRIRKTPGILADAFAAYGMEKSSGTDRIEEIAEDELRSYIYHEIGEAVEGEKLKSIWPEMLGCASGRKAAAFLRGVKDILADTSPKGMLAHIITNRKYGSLAFYISHLLGYRIMLAEKIQKAFYQLKESGNWDTLEEARSECYKASMGIAEKLADIFAKSAGHDDFTFAIEEYLKENKLA